MHEVLAMNRESYLKWDSDFGPSYTPMEMLDQGVYVGVFTDTLEVLSKYRHHEKVTGVPRRNINRYSDKSPSAISYSKTKKLIEGSVLDWWQWYINYFEGKRKTDDKKYISNWKYYVQQMCERLRLATDEAEELKIKQALLEVGWDPNKIFTDDNITSNARLIAKKANGVNLNTEFFNGEQSDLVNYGGFETLGKLFKGFNPVKGKPTNTKIELTATALSLLPLISVEEADGFITVTGFNFRKFQAMANKILKSSRYKFLFSNTGYRSFKFPSFFAVEVARTIDLIIDARKDHGLLALKKKLITNTWLGTVVKAEPLPFDYTQLNRLNVSVLPKQREFLESYAELVPRLGLNGWLLAAAPGTGKTLTGIAWHLVNKFDVTIIVSPNNAVEDVWEKHFHKFFDKVPKYWLSRPKFGAITGKEEFIVVHYEQLANVLSQLNKIKGKRVGLWLDESHNFNELTAQRTNLLIEMAQEYCEQSVFASGTPLKALGRELVPLFRIIDVRFTPYVEERFIKVFGATKGAVLKLLEFRMDRSAFKVAKEEVVNNEVTEYQLDIRIPKPENYLLSSVRHEIAEYVAQRTRHYAEMSDEIVEEYFKYILALPKDVTSTNDYKTYMSYVRTMNRKFDPYSHGDLIKFCSKFEKDYILPTIDPTERKYFKSVAAKYKYVILVIRGEALGRILTRRRIECIKDMVYFSDLDSYVDSATKKTVIFTNYVEVVDELNQYFTEQGFTPKLVYGKTNKELGDTLKAFKDDPKANPIIATYNSLSTAVPLVEASTIVLFDSPFRNYIIEQTIARLDRLDQDSAISVVRARLDTDGAPNLSTRSIELAEWSKELVDSVLNLSKASDTVLQTEYFNEEPVLLQEYFNVRLESLKRDTLPEELYHLSFDKNLPKVLKPQLPAGSELAKGKVDDFRHEPSIPRVCFSTSIEGAFRAIYVNIQEIVEKHGKDGIEFSVYKRIGSPLDKGISTNTLSQRAVWDAQVTDEWWCLEPTRVRKVGKVIIKCDSFGEWLEFIPEADPYKKPFEHTPRDIEMELKLEV